MPYGLGVLPVPAPPPYKPAGVRPPAATAG